ncbi:uncharacterized protein [Venturia canescens]|uniref:uncharacterized protein n=1 Tax=Venturia canescens TaxID=32260 RepID=UPI001C9CC15F|nr:uncharacterized protein LOC122414902 [Venturia canescens]
MFYSPIMPRPLSNFLHCFTLKQGTILIAVVQLFAAGIAVTFCILALTHAVDIREMVARDAEEDTMDRGYSMDDDNSMRVNIKRMKIAGDNAKGKVDEMWYHLMLWLTHLSCIILLLYGVLTFHRRFMIPWIYLNALEIVLFIILLAKKKHAFDAVGCTILLLELTGVAMHFHSTYVVWSTYMSIHYWKKGLIHQVYDIRNNKTIPRQSISECTTSSSSSHSSRLPTKPYEV